MHKFSGFALLGLLAVVPASADEVTSYGRRPDLPSLKTAAIEINPLDIYAQLSIGVSEDITVGPSISALRYGIGFIEDVTVRGYAVGLQSTINLSGHRFTDGWVVQPSFGYYNYDLTVSIPSIAIFGPAGPPSTYAGNFHGLYGGLVAGYQWVWDELVTLSFGGGATVYSRGRDTVVSGSGKTTGTSKETSLYGGVNPTVMFNLGFVL